MCKFYKDIAYYSEVLWSNLVEFEFCNSLFLLKYGQGEKKCVKP